MRPQTHSSMSSPRLPASKLRPNARACDTCRQMKVKCEDFDNPPCVRCRKARRACVFQFPPHTRNSGSPIQYTSAHTSHGVATPPVGHKFSIPATRPGSSSRGSSNVNENDFLSQQDGTGSEVGTYGIPLPAILSSQNKENDLRVPPVYFTSPLDSVSERGNTADTRIIDSRSGGRRVVGIDNQGTRWSLGCNGPYIQAPSSNKLILTETDMRGIIHTFCKSLLPYISVLSPLDFQDPDKIISTDLPLAHAICYVTASYLSGGEQLRDMLIPSVSQILAGKLVGPQNQSTQISTLKSLLILYNYAGCSSPTTDKVEKSQPEHLLFWPLKSLVEVYGLRLSLHRSYYDLQVELRTSGRRVSPITESLSYQKYIFWLQLFTLSKYCSVMTGTPPTIPVDLTIRAAPRIMDEIGMNPQAALFGEVELAIIWEKVGSQKQLGEWWSQYDPARSRSPDESETVAMLRDADKLIDAWYQRWAYRINVEDTRGGILDYLGRCNRFYIHSYATRSFSPSLTSLTGIQKTQVQTCIRHASRVLDWPLDLSPFQRERLRYISDSAGIMVSFCCLFIVASCQTFGPRIPSLLDCLHKVEASARLMLDMAPNADHSIHAQGTLILRRLDALRQGVSDASGNRSEASDIAPGLLNNNGPPGVGPLDGIYNFEESDSMSAMDMFWDFSMLTPGFGFGFNC